MFSRLDEFGEEKRAVMLFFAMNFMLYVCIAVFMPYLAAHYANLGIDSGRIGILVSIGSIATIFILPIWSSISDKTGNRRLVLKIVTLGSCLTILLFIVSNSFVTLLFTVSAFFCFQVGIIPLSDAIAIAHLSKSKINFSRVRLGGTFGFGVMILISGHVYNYSSTYTFILGSVCLFLLYFFVRKIPQVEVQKKEKRKLELRRVFRNKKVFFILFIAFAVQVAQGFYFTFMGVYVQELGFTTREIGIAHFMAILVEIPVFLLIDRILKRFSVITVTIFCGFIVAVRLLMLFIATDMTIIYISMLGNGVSFIGMYYSCATFINKEMDDDLKSTGQSLLALCQMGLGNITGNLLGGYISLHFGTGYAFLYFGFALAAVCTICALVFTTLRIINHRHCEEIRATGNTKQSKIISKLEDEEKTMLKIAIIGTGNISPAHIEGYLELRERCQIVALCDIVPEKCEKTKERFKLESAVIYDNHKTLLENSNFDLVSICTPPFCHAEIAIDCLNAGRNVIVEKPMAASLQECDAMAEAAEASGKMLSIIAQNRFRTPVWNLNQVLKNGIIGKIVHVQVDSFWWRGHCYYDLWWRGLWEKEGGGCTLNHAVHHIDMLGWMMGKPQEVCAMLTNAAHDNAEVEDLSVAVMRYDNGALAQVTSSVVNHGEEQQIVFNGEKARISAPWRIIAQSSQPNGFPVANKELETEIEKLYNSLPPVKYEGHTGQIENVLTAIETGTAPIVGANEGRLTIELITAIYKAGTEKCFISLPITKEDPFYTVEGIQKNVPKFYKKTTSAKSLDGEITLGSNYK